jgi:allantoinase
MDSSQKIRPVQATTVSAPAVRWSAMPTRPAWTWPGGTSLAVAVLLHVEFVPLAPPGLPIANSVTHRGPYPDHPDIHEISPHEYGNRVGVFRLKDRLDAHGLTASAAIDTNVARFYPGIVSRLAASDWSVLGHGRTGAVLQSELIDAASERELIRENLDAIELSFGRRPRGWAPVEYGESSRTADLLAEAGLEYLCGRPNDEQPYPLENGLTAVPISIHLDDIFAGRLRKIDAVAHADSVIEAIRVLDAEHNESPRLLVLGVRPWFTGQPFRVKQFDRILSALRASSAWVAGLDEVVDHHRQATEGLER